jgi:hypothetical protein
MKHIIILLSLTALFCINCTDGAEPLLSHVYGWANRKSDSTGINNLTIRIRDINCYALDQSRDRTVLTHTVDSIDGYFEMDSVCYGTSNNQGTGYVIFFIDSINNPAYSDTNWFPDIQGPADTIIFYMED